MRKTDVIALAPVVVGALTWGLVAVASFDLVATALGLEFGQTNAATRVVYGLVGLSGLWLVARAPKLVTVRSAQRAAVTA